MRRTCVHCILALLAATLVATAVAAPTSQPAAVASGRAGDDAYDWNQWRQHWSFKPISFPKPPIVKDGKWGRNAVDPFILAKLESEGLTPAGEAGKVELIRRATYDLTGLPPTPQEIKAFVNDPSAEAFDKVVDRLLASPHYGEKWGRRWLDVARYVQGRINFPGVKRTSGDSHYRDYVVRAFNTDKPYDRFVTEQLAGDLLPASGDQQQQFDQIIAPAFLSIGAWFDQCTDPNRLKLEMVDEQINTVSKAFLGLTVACARCHDHKFEPIPTADYYALGGIFRSTRLVGDFSEYWRDGRVRQLRPLAMPDQVAANDAIKAQIEAKKAERWAYLTAKYNERMTAWKQQEAQYRAAATEITKPFVSLFEAENFDGVANLRIAQLQKDGKGIDLIESLNPTTQWVKYKIEVPDTGDYRLEALYCTDDRVPVEATVNGPAQVKGALAEPTGGWDLNYLRWGTVGTLNLRVGLDFLRLNAKDGEFPRIDRFRLYQVDKGFDEQIAKVATAHSLDPKLLAAFVIDPDRPWPTTAGIDVHLTNAERKTATDLSAEIVRLEGTITPYDLTISVTDQPAAQCADLPVHIKGDTYKVSEKPNPRGTIRLFDHLLPPPQIDPGRSGRLELARWLTDPRNPLPARVMANRIWQGHFGKGIVATASDFGSRGAPPTHPELLDYLATELLRNGWSIKKLHRLIMLSATYRMSCQPWNPATVAKDPENKLLARFPRRRLSAEELYDAMLTTTNRMVRQDYNPVNPGSNVPPKPFDLEKAKSRAMYVLSSNRSPKNLGAEVRKMFPLFDYDPTGVPIDSRSETATPAQSLFWINNPLPRFFADLFAERLLKMDQLSEPKRIDMAYQLATGRSPPKQTIDEAAAFLTACRTEDKMDDRQAWTELCLAIYASTEFRYVE